MSRAQDIFDRVVANGISAVEAFVVDRQAEELFLDFKRSSNDGNDKRLSSPDRKNLAKAISGFGNSEGGVIVWGVDCSTDYDGADVAKALVPIENPKRFCSLIQGAISGCTIPPHSGVLSEIVEMQNDKGFVVTLIPKSDSAPHQSVVSKHYYIRAGSDFVPTPHDVLAGMFGRRPQPHVFQNFILAVPKLENDCLCISVGLAVHNEGPGIASDVFSLCRIESMPGTNCTANIETTDTRNWVGHMEFARQVSLISAAGYRLPPGATAQPLVIHLKFKPPFEDELRIFGRVGGSGSRRYDFYIRNSVDAVQRHYNAMVKMTVDGFHSNDEFHKLAETLLTTTDA
ncbi:MAG: ATP-binding protein [Rhodocyclaceae bacterium]|nr:ATP-binding protein [Rhodocyclaceae bacterium]